MFYPAGRERRGSIPNPQAVVALGAPQIIAEIINCEIVELKSLDSA
jgi:hypothetical protein